MDIKTSTQQRGSDIMCLPKGAHSPALAPRQQGYHFPLPQSPLSLLTAARECGREERPLLGEEEREEMNA